MEETNDTVSREVYPLPVLLYSRPDCQEVKAQREYLEQLGISFVEVDVEGDPEASQFARQYNRGDPCTPVIVFGDREMILARPDRNALDTALRQAGYGVGKNAVDNI